MSLLGKKWVIQNQDEKSGVVEKLLSNRDLLSEDKQRAFFEGSLSDLHDPLLMKGMKEAVERIRKAILDEEKIMVFGDYDVDGITSTVILYDFLKKVGANVEYTLPNREKDGYGLKDYFIKDFKERGIQLIVTVDCGTANFDEVRLANELAIDVIITDHHDIPEVLPEACAVVNPKQEDCAYPNRELSGSGVSYKLVSALVPYYFDSKTAAEYLYEQLGIATLGLVADCMPLVDENRIMTRFGLKSLEESKNPGLKALMESAGVSGKMTGVTIGFYLGPRLNAAGRLDSAHHALELLLGDAGKVETLSKLNVERQKTVETFLKEARAQVDNMESIPPIVVVSGKQWHVGTLGLIAGKLCDHFKRPAIAMQEREDEFVASCRSLNDFDITSFLRKEAGDLFTSFGGHKLAGGFSIPKENVATLKERLSSTAHQHIDPKDFQDTLPIDCEIAPHEINWEISNKINRLEPFGNGNPEPTLLLKNIRIADIKPVGKNGSHLHLPIRYGDKKINAIAFRFGEHLDKIDLESHYDVAFNLEVNEWNGYKKLQMKIVDLKAVE